MRISLTIGDRKPWRARVAPGGSRTVILGSDRGCDVVLTGSGVAPRHAELAIDQGGVWVCAHAPLTVDGEALVGWTVAAPGARLRIGDHDVLLGLEEDDGKGGKRATTADTQAAALPSAARGAEAPDADRDERLAQLGQVFALPPPEALAVKHAPPAFLGRRFFRLSVKSWLLAAGTGLVSLFAFNTREIPRASASRNVARPSVKVVAPARAGVVPPAQTSKPVRLDEVRAAADRIFAGDSTAALSLYRALATRDVAFAPFVRALEQRTRKTCTPDRSGGGGPCP
jgi:hypothetical protein